jgi:hypothetical protein
MAACIGRIASREGFAFSLTNPGLGGTEGHCLYFAEDRASVPILVLLF